MSTRLLDPDNISWIAEERDLLEHPKTFCDEFSRPIAFIRKFMEKTGYTFWNKYAAIDHKVSGPDLRPDINRLIPQGDIEISEELTVAELQTSYNRVTYIGRSKENPQKGMAITFAKLGDRFPLNTTPIDGNPPKTVPEFLEAFGYKYKAVEGYSGSKAESYYECYKGEHDNYDDEIWVTFFNFNRTNI